MATATETPKIVSHEQWLAARKVFLEKEKELTRAKDALSAERRKLPMVKVDKEYHFKSFNGDEVSLSDLFDNKEQLIVYHFMFSPEDDRGCSGCTFTAECFPDARHLRFKNTNFVCVSRAPPEKLKKYKSRAGWTFPWYSSQGGDFNQDFYATIDNPPQPGALLNFRTKDEVDGVSWYSGDVPGYSIFWKRDGNVYHTYSTFARGGETVLTVLQLLDMTPLGRQDSPDGPGGFKLADEYGDK